MWQSRNKTDLMIEVWEKLDCESIGAAEIEAISTVVRDVYGPQAVDSPMKIARLLASEGAYLRHSEIMELYVARAEDRPYEAAFASILNIDGLRAALNSIRKLEGLRRKYLGSGDRDGLRLVHEHGLTAKQNALETAARDLADPELRSINQEISQWFTVWLQTPEAFESWVLLRRRSRDFVDRFGQVDYE
jgi:hypothetical protein